MVEGALQGIRVLDASQMMAGPLCGLRLGDLGADVLKIEPPGRGEWVRSHGFANAEIKGQTTALLGLNRNKRSVTANLKSPEGIQVLYDLVRISDVFIQNYRVGTAERLGAGYQKLREINPRIIYASISGYGEEGPYRMRPGQDLVAQGYSGSLFSVGSRKDLPTPGPVFAADAITAYLAAIGVLAALWARQRTGKGQKVETNLLASLMDAQIQELTTHLNLGVLPQRTEEPLAHAWNNAPYGVYRTADGWITLAMAPLDAVGEALDNDRLREMKEWSDGVTYRDEASRIISSITPTRTTAEWLEAFERQNVWAGPVYNYADLANDPHVKATGMLTTVEHPTIGPLKMPNVPIRMSETPPRAKTHPPLLGEHTDAVLRDWLGYDDSRLKRLHEIGAI
jgi:crotonobetainyl-CoA:carnitine CoA-transferase CaiB-like acyl-CoA transferase